MTVKSVCCSVQAFFLPGISLPRAETKPLPRLGHQQRADVQSTWLVRSNQLLLQLLFGVMHACQNAHSTISACFPVPEKDKLVRWRGHLLSPLGNSSRRREEPLPLALQASLFKESPMLLSGTDTFYHFPGRNSTPSAAPG